MKKKYKIILSIVAIVVLIGLITSIFDYSRFKENKEPIFCIKLSNGSTGKIIYIGLGYKVIRYTGVSINEPFKNNIGVKFGNWLMSYEIEEIENKNIYKK